MNRMMPPCRARRGTGSTKIIEGGQSTCPWDCCHYKQQVGTAVSVHCNDREPTSAAWWRAAQPCPVMVAWKACVYVWWSAPQWHHVFKVPHKKQLSTARNTLPSTRRAMRASGPPVVARQGRDGAIVPL